MNNVLLFTKKQIVHNEWPNRRDITVLPPARTQRVTPPNSRRLLMSARRGEQAGSRQAQGGQVHSATIICAYAMPEVRRAMMPAAGYSHKAISEKQHIPSCQRRLQLPPYIPRAATLLRRQTGRVSMSLFMPSRAPPSYMRQRAAALRELSRQRFASPTGARCCSRDCHSSRFTPDGGRATPLPRLAAYHSRELFHARRRDAGTSPMPICAVMPLRVEPPRC